QRSRRNWPGSVPGAMATVSPTMAGLIREIGAEKPEWWFTGFRKSLGFGTMKKIAQTLVDAKILDRALLVGVLCEAAFVALCHSRPLINEHFGLFGCMMIAGTAALLYARDLARGYVAGA